MFLTLNTLTWVYRFFVQFSLHSYRTDKENLFSNQELLQLKFNFIFSKNLSGEIHQIETSWVSWQHSGNSLKMKRKECSSKWIILRLWYDLLSFFFSLFNLKYTCMCHTVVFVQFWRCVSLLETIIFVNKKSIKSMKFNKHDAINIADPSSMQDMCHMNLLIDLAHNRVSVS